MRKWDAVKPRKPDEQLSVIGYIRVSTEDQHRHGVSLEAQQQFITQHCQQRGWHLQRCIVDPEHTGRNLNRPGIHELLALCREGAVEGIITVDIDRLSRDPRDCWEMIDDTLNPHGVHLIALDQQLDTTTAIGRAVIGMIITFAQMEREMTGERTSRALQAKKRAGKRYSSRIPYGWKLAANRTDLEPDIAQLDLIATMFELRAQGYSYWRAAKELNARHIPPQQGRQWWASSVRVICTRVEAEMDDDVIAVGNGIEQDDAEVCAAFARLSAAIGEYQEYAAAEQEVG